MVFLERYPLCRYQFILQKVVFLLNYSAQKYQQKNKWYFCHIFKTPSMIQLIQLKHLPLMRQEQRFNYPSNDHEIQRLICAFHSYYQIFWHVDIIVIKQIDFI